MKIFMALCILAVLFILQPVVVSASAEAYKVNIFLVSPPNETWTNEEITRAVGATLDATSWWSRNSKIALPAFELGFTKIITPTDFSYAVNNWERPYQQYTLTSLTVFIIDNSNTHGTLGYGIMGLSSPAMRVITVTSDGANNNQDGLAFVIAHEYGHAWLNLNFNPDPTAWDIKEHAPVGSFDIMAPSPSLATYLENNIGYYTRVTMGETFKKSYLPLIQKL